MFLKCENVDKSALIVDIFLKTWYIISCPQQEEVYKSWQ